MNTITQSPWDGLVKDVWQGSAKFGVGADGKLTERWKVGQALEGWNFDQLVSVKGDNGQAIGWTKAS